MLGEIAFKRDDSVRFLSDGELRVGKVVGDYPHRYIITVKNGDTYNANEDEMELFEAFDPQVGLWVEWERKNETLRGRIISTRVVDPFGNRQDLVCVESTDGECHILKLWCLRHCSPPVPAEPTECQV